MSRLSRLIRRFRREEEGLALVEFAICLPLTILLLGFALEGARTMWSYQAAIEGVRDATRYLARITSGDVCSGGTFAPPESDLINIVSARFGTTQSVFPAQIKIVNTTADDFLPDYKCVALPIKGETVAVATLKAKIQIVRPMAPLFLLATDGISSTLEVEISDESRIYGL